MALAQGYDWAEATYGSLRFAQRWNGVAFGDPLYAPFRSAQVKDQTPPVLGAVAARPAGDDAKITIELAGKTADELADVALFKLQYGPTAEYGQQVDYFDWPGPQDSSYLKDRRFGWSRRASWTVKGPTEGESLHLCVIARDPAGNQTVSPDVVFRP